MKNLLYISDCFVNSTVFESQVHTICNEHSNNFNVTLLALCNASEIKKDGKINSSYKLIKYKKPPKLFIPFMQKIALFTYKDISIFKDADIIHCRGHIGAAFAINICKKYNLNKNIIADIRGAIPEEIFYKKGFAFNYFSMQATKLEKFVFMNSNYFYFVSKNMQDYYTKKYNLKDNSSVFPTIVNEKFFFISKEKRLNKRKLLNLNNKFVYIYVGGVDKWQKLDEILKKFHEQSKNNHSLFLLIVTTNPNHVQNILLDLNITNINIEITTSKYEDVPEYLNAADAGLIIREDNIINRVASPTKVNEYLSCGLKVVDDLSEIGNIQYNKKNTVYIPLEEIIIEQEKIYKKLGSI